MQSQVNLGKKKKSLLYRTSTDALTGVRRAVRCVFWPILVLRYAVWFSQNHNRTAPHFCNYMCCAVLCGVVQNLAKTITAPHLIFAIICAVQCIRCGLKLVYFSNFGLFLPSQNLFFALF